MDAAMDSPLNMAVAILLGTYHSAAGENGKVSKDSFLELVGKEMPGLGEEIFQGCDINQDGFMDFKEFSVLVLTLAASSNDFLEKAMKENKGKK